MQVRLDQYVGMIQQKQVDYFEAMNFTFSDPPTITVDYGKKYAKVVKNDNLNGARSVHSFIDMSIGDIIHRMIATFADSGDAKDTIDKLLK